LLRHPAQRPRAARGSLGPIGKFLILMPFSIELLADRIPACAGMTSVTIRHLAEGSPSTRRLDPTRSSTCHPCASRGPEKDQTEDWVPAFAGTTAWRSRAGKTTTPHGIWLSFPGWALRGMKFPVKAGSNIHRLTG